MSSSDSEPLEPFWEAGYRDDEFETWGTLSRDLVAIVNRLPEGGLALDAGCGEGRNALFLAERGFEVRAFDVSEAGIGKLRRRAEERGLEIDAGVGGLDSLDFDRSFDVIVAEGLLQSWIAPRGIDSWRRRVGTPLPTERT